MPDAHDERAPLHSSVVVVAAAAAPPPSSPAASARSQSDTSYGALARTR